MDYVTYDSGEKDQETGLTILPQFYYRFDPEDYILANVLGPSSCNTSLAFWLGREAIEEEEEPILPTVPPGGVIYSVCRPDENGRWQGHVENYQWQGSLMFCHPSECSTYRYTFWLGAEGLNDEDY